MRRPPAPPRCLRRSRLAERRRSTPGSMERLSAPAPPPLRRSTARARARW
jgi:hypothetical protein